MKHLRRHSNYVKRFMILLLALAALIGYISLRNSDFAGQVEAQSGLQQLSKSSEPLKTTRAALDQAIAKEKLAPSEEASNAVDAAQLVYNRSRADRMKAIATRRQELESSVRTIVSSLGIDAKLLREALETKHLMAEHDALTAEFVALSPRTPVAELEGNNEIATADRIIGGNSEIGVRSGVIAPGGDVDFYSVESKAGEVLDFSVTVHPAGAKKSARIEFELLTPDGMVELLSFTSDSKKASGEPLRFSVPESGKYIVKVKAARSRQTSGYELMVKRTGGSMEILGGPQTCTTADFEGGADGFTVEPVFPLVGPALWHLSTTCGAELPGHTTPTTFYYGIECNAPVNGDSAGNAFNTQGSFTPAGTCSSTCDYNTGTRNASNLVSPVVNVTSPASLTFNYLLFVESTTNVDLTFVDVSTDGGSTWTPVLDKFDLINDNAWHTAMVDLSPFVGAATSVRVRFRFDSVDSLFNNTTGWHVDDVQICGENPDPCANDTTPPTIDCPDPITAVAQASCPPSAGAAVAFSPPTASDNCPGVTVACVPPSGSTFPAGTTTVTCTATDASGNTATCSFPVTVFSACLQDEANPGNVVLFNISTGEYRFCCGGVVIKAGKGTVNSQGCTFTITHNTADRRVLIKVSFNTKDGSASVQMPPGTVKCRITDKNIANNSCQCPAAF